MEKSEMIQSSILLNDCVKKSSASQLQKMLVSSNKMMDENYVIKTPSSNYLHDRPQSGESFTIVLDNGARKYLSVSSPNTTIVSSDGADRNNFNILLKPMNRLVKEAEDKNIQKIMERNAVLTHNMHHIR